MKTKFEIAGFLKSNVALFNGFDEEVLGALVDGSRVVSLEPNEAILHYGEKLAHLGIVLAGTAVAWVLEGGTGKQIRRVERGDTFGVMALAVRDAMIADIVAESDCEVLLIPITLFRSAITAATDEGTRDRTESGAGDSTRALHQAKRVGDDEA